MGCPTDRDKVFLSNLWKELFRLADVQLQMSSAYHPQSDGQTERVNQCLETFLRCFVHACPTQWSHWLSVAQFWYNSSPHSATGRAPFEVLYGCRPRQFGISDNAVISSTELSAWLQDRQLISDLVKQHLERAKMRMKRQEDKQRSEREFTVGDWVFLKLQPYVQSSVAHRANQKLAFKFFGPFQVIQRVGSVAYKLQLPSSSRIHPVFHVSQLKRALGKGLVASPALPSDQYRFSVPVKILQHRSSVRGLNSCPQVLVQWSAMPEELATWENVQDLQQQFPNAAVWGHPACLVGGNVSITEEKDNDSQQEGDDQRAGPTTVPVGPPYAKRVRKRNAKVYGPAWVN